MQHPTFGRSAQRTKAPRRQALRGIVDSRQPPLQENGLGFGLHHTVPVDALAGIALVPLEADRQADVQHGCILLPYTLRARATFASSRTTPLPPARGALGLPSRRGPWSTVQRSARRFLPPRQRRTRLRRRFMGSFKAFGPIATRPP